jgi:ComF family protein
MPRIDAWVKPWLNAGLALFYPEVCQICKKARATPAEGYICPACREDVRYVEPPLCDRCGLPFEGEITQVFECSNCQGTEWFFSRARSAVKAKGMVLEAIHGYKYNHRMWFEPFLAGLLVDCALMQLVPGQWDCVIPVPLYHVKKRERQFNQAERLGAPLAEALGVRLRTDLLKRVEPTATQTRLSREERQRNVRRAFAMASGASAAGLRVVLVDDVFTTGSTTNACARRLREAGAAEVCVWTVARGI